MPEEMKMPHQLILQDRQRLTLSGIESVDRFDEETVVLTTTLGRLTVEGSGLKVQHLSVETGDLAVEGRIGGLHYEEQHKGRRVGRLFR